MATFMTLAIILLACFAIMLASLGGVFFLIANLEDWTDRNLKYLISFSSGMFLFICYHLIEEALELSYSTHIAILSVIIGLISIHFFSKLWPEFHHHHEKADHDHEHSTSGVRRILLSDGIHNIGDGIILAATFTVSITLGLALTISIFIHEAIQEISEFFVLKEAGLSTRAALQKNFLTSGTILIGALIGYFVTANDYIIGPLLGFSAGSFLYILLIDLLPKSVRSGHKEKSYVRHLLCAVVGIALIVTVNYFIGHE